MPIALFSYSLYSTSCPSSRRKCANLTQGVLRDAEYIYSNSIDVFIDMYGTKAAAASIYASMQERGYSTDSWSQHELHPTRSEGFSDLDIVNFVFTMDLLNFSFVQPCLSSVTV